MPELTVKTRLGEEKKIDGKVGYTVMEAIREANINDTATDGVFAICGGCRACGTCHVYVDDASKAAFGVMEPEESDLLDMSDQRTGQSRLSCQLKITEAANGAHFTIAPDF
ncbi:MAG: 2Fe-2S iron-sulfur cluster-binding protein [Caulobacterales bacterium]